MKELLICEECGDEIEKNQESFITDLQIIVCPKCYANYLSEKETEYEEEEH